MTSDIYRSTLLLTITYGLFALPTKLHWTMGYRLGNAWLQRVAGNDAPVVSEINIFYQIK
jgi:hypothetical protein